MNLAEAVAAWASLKVRPLSAKQAAKIKRLLEYVIQKSLSQKRAKYAAFIKFERIDSTPRQ